MNNNINNGRNKLATVGEKSFNENFFDELDQITRVGVKKNTGDKKKHPKKNTKKIGFFFAIFFAVFSKKHKFFFKLVF